MNPNAEEYMSVGEARALLEVSKPKMADLLKPGKNGEPPVLEAITDPLNKRYKWIRRADVIALKEQQKKLAA